MHQQTNAADVDLLNTDDLNLLDQTSSSATVDELQAIFDDLFEGADPSTIDIDKFCNEVIEEEIASATLSGHNSPTLQGQGGSALPALGDEASWSCSEIGQPIGVNMCYTDTPVLQADPILFTPSDDSSSTSSILISSPTNTEFMDDDAESDSSNTAWPLSNFYSLSSSSSDVGYELEMDNSDDAHLFPFDYHNHDVLSSAI